MYKEILICLDNSPSSNTGIDLSMDIARGMGSGLTGVHVYAARLHNARFREMEGGFAEEYLKEGVIQNTRQVHDTLITKGLKIISDSYMTVLHARAEAAELTASGVSREGKNFEEIVSESEEDKYGLIVMGALGLGKTGALRLGSVAQRAVRRIKKDVLVTREAGSPDGNIVVAIDGSPLSFGGLLTAIELSRVFNRTLEAVSAYDPEFHYTAFRSIAGVLSEEAGRALRFKEQEKLHEEIIDKGLARIYRGHLDTAASIAAEQGVDLKTTLLTGKASDEIVKYAEKSSPFLLVLGKTGAHASPSLDIGSVTENCLRETGCHTLVSSRYFAPSAKEQPNGPSWTEDAQEVLAKVPQFARAIVKNMVEDAARKKGLTGITADFMRMVRKKMEG